MFTAGLNQAMVLGNVQGRLLQLREAINAVVSLQNWAAGVQAADLQALGFSSTDAPTLLSAISEANGVATNYAANSAFQRQVIGPQ